MAALSPRLLAVVEALPLKAGIRVLEIGCGPGAMARDIANRIEDGHVLAIDRSAKAIKQAQHLASAEILAGRMSVRQCAAEDLYLLPDEPAYDLAVAIRVGAFDGRHPAAGVKARRAIAACLKPGSALYIDGGDPLRQVLL